MTVHSFATSDGHEDAEWWTSFYRNAFFPHYVDHTNNTAADTQKRGVDHRVRMVGDTFVVTDAKVRSDVYDDVLLEIWSNWEAKVKGWAVKSQETTYLAYVFPTVARGWLIPFHLMQRALFTHKREWAEWADNKQHGFRWSDAKNRSAGGGTYTTRSMIVPYAVLVTAMAEPVSFTINMADRIDAA